MEGRFGELQLMLAVVLLCTIFGLACGKKGGKKDGEEAAKKVEKVEKVENAPAAQKKSEEPAPAKPEEAKPEEAKP